MANEAEIEREIQEKGLTAPRLTPEAIDDLIVFETYDQNLGDPNMALSNTPHKQVSKDDITALACLTICVLVLRNGFTVVGHSACASPENFDAALGRKIARADARDKIWPLAGYALREKLAGL